MAPAAPDPTTVSISAVTAKGKLTVTGAGSQLLTTGVNTFINVGANNSLGDGTFELLAGATASTLYVNVGRDGGKGVMLIGAGTTVDAVGRRRPYQSAGNNGPAFATIGRNGASGAVTASNGGQWLISDSGLDGRTAAGGPGMFVGAGGANATEPSITGAGLQGGDHLQFDQPRRGRRRQLQPLHGGRPRKRKHRNAGHQRWRQVAIDGQCTFDGQNSRATPALHRRLQQHRRRAAPDGDGHRRGSECGSGRRCFIAVGTTATAR